MQFLSKTQLAITLVVLLGLYSYELYDTKIHNDIEDAAVVLAYSILEYNFKGLQDLEILAIINTWQKDAWGAQIASLRVLCEINENKLLILMSKDTQIKACRFAK